MSFDPNIGGISTSITSVGKKNDGGSSGGTGYMRKRNPRNNKNNPFENNKSIFDNQFAFENLDIPLNKLELLGYKESWLDKLINKFIS